LADLAGDTADECRECGTYGDPDSTA